MLKVYVMLNISMKLGLGDAHDNTLNLCYLYHLPEVSCFLFGKIILC